MCQIRARETARIGTARCYDMDERYGFLKRSLLQLAMLASSPPTTTRQAVDERLAAGQQLVVILRRLRHS